VRILTTRKNARLPVVQIKMISALCSIDAERRRADRIFDTVVCLNTRGVRDGTMGGHVASRLCSL
jgi:hypothetical protein